MGFFNFIDTFFFISLGITCVLISLLVYHFKQRINSLEHKCDTMFEIINSVAQELSTQRISHVIPPPRYSNYEGGAVKVPITFTLDNNVNDSKILVSDDENDDENEDESDDESDDDESEDEDDDDDESDDDEDDANDANCQDMNDGINVTELPNQIKIINVDMNEQVEITEVVMNPVEDDNNETDTEENNITDLLNDEILHVEKLDSNDEDENKHLDNTDNDLSQIQKQKETNIEIYRKMSVQELKTLVISKGLCSDASKLKKVELLKMLDSAEDN